MLRSIKTHLRRWAYRRFPVYVANFRKAFRQPEGDAPFNLQKERKKIFEAMTKEISPSVICETGTFRGKTTAYFACNFSCPIYSSELILHSHKFSKSLLASYSHVNLYFGDSRQFLRECFEQGWIPSNGIAYFYLDAHWYDDCPLLEELAIICSELSEFVILIDDFEVSRDPGYGFDEYQGGTLSMTLIAPLVAMNQVHVLIPNIPSFQETGGKRGWVVLAKGKHVVSRLRTVEGLTSL